MTRALMRAAPSSPTVRELHGLACYRLGKWDEAIRYLELVIEASSDLISFRFSWIATGRSVGASASRISGRS